jgi:RimJ/RimL family protein N-acetyltransferase
MSASNATLRDARLEDAALLCTAEREIASRLEGLLVSDPQELREESFRERIAVLSDERGKYLIAESGGAVVAHACLYPMAPRRLAHVLRLDMCVHAGHWRQGHGEALLRALLAWARHQATALKIELLVRSENLPAVALYEKLGFVMEGRLKGRVRLNSGRLVDDLSMGYELEK